MPVVQVEKDVYWIGVNDRTTDLFEGLWPITREGISYNAYLVTDEKKALIDLTKSFKTNEFFNQIDEIADISKLDYIVVNHVEPDHTGTLQTLRRIAPRAVILGMEKTKEMLAAFYGTADNIRVVGVGDTLSLGRRTLQFFSTPFVHWPETMMTYEASHGILFSCDRFGGYGALRGGIFDTECEDLDFYEREALRYYSNIVARFSSFVLKALDRLADVEIRTVAPSHGLIWRSDPARIFDLYRKWAVYATGETEKAITLIYGSMYGNTEAVMNAVAQGISRRGVPVEIFDGARAHASYVLASLWTKQGVLIGAPTYELGLFPPVAHLLDLAIHKGIRNKKVAYFGSYGWTGGALKQLQKTVQPAGWDLVDSMEFMGGPSQDDLKKAEVFAEQFAGIIEKREPGSPDQESADKIGAGSSSI